MRRSSLSICGSVRYVPDTQDSRPLFVKARVIAKASQLLRLSRCTHLYVMNDFHRESFAKLLMLAGSLGPCFVETSIRSISS